MNSIFGLGQLPEIFYPDKDIKTAQTLLPVRIAVLYPVWPLAVAFVGIVLLLVVSIAGIMVLNREKYYKVEVDGNLVNVSVKPFKTKAVYSSKGEKVGDLRGTLIGRPQVKSVNKGTDIRLR
jgi:hypothetical protein